MNHRVWASGLARTDDKWMALRGQVTRSRHSWESKYH